MFKIKSNVHIWTTAQITWHIGMPVDLTYSIYSISATLLKGACICVTRIKLEREPEIWAMILWGLVKAVKQFIQWKRGRKKLQVP